MSLSGTPAVLLLKRPLFMRKGGDWKMTKQIITTDAELKSVMLFDALVDIWMGNYLYGKIK